ncbi:histidine phosphatase family protein [Clostridium fallax]|uniref:Probable phosphoglycerate mutase n=1 Tax=Clostridium fallax TaxID=1533 RepID=A0A1M4YUR5_9CLOT|nr:histidine phosphatase family protein [Clostridium fallax]SHF09511.1 probable phosphoglycerate mutase [Clostridium fallax]SQB22168.1 phosphoglycerate mutase family protein [Clostridium fallax]
MNIYITRHGETEWNTEKRMQGWRNSNLTELGLKQAEALRDRLQDINLDVIYASPLKRAYDTANIIKGSKNIEIIKSDDLREMGFGNWEGMTLEEIESHPEYKDEIYNLYNNPVEYKPFGGETINNVSERVHNILDEIIQNNKYKDILIVTHGMTLKFVMAYFAKKAKMEYEDVIFGQASLTHVKLDDNKIKLMSVNDTSHYKK